MKGMGHALTGTLKTHLQNFISISIIPQISKQSVQWLLRTHPDKFGLASKEPESAILKFKPFETLLHNFIFISILSPNFRPILPVVNENLHGQNLGNKKKKKK